MPEFYAIERSKAKASAPEQTAAYIEALEKIAKAGYELWKICPLLSGHSLTASRADDLYDALEVVNFMDEEAE